MGVENFKTKTEKKVEQIETSREWPAMIEGSVKIQRPDGNFFTISFEEWLKRKNNNNRAGT